MVFQIKYTSREPKPCNGLSTVPELKEKLTIDLGELDSTDICQGLQTLRCILELLEFESYFLKGG